MEPPPPPPGYGTSDYTLREILVSAASIGLQSNYDATSLKISYMFGMEMSDAVPKLGTFFSPGSDGNQWQQVPIKLTLTTSVGQFDIHNPDDYGMSHTETSSFTWNATADEIVDALDYVQLVLPPDYVGNYTISVDSNDTVVTVDQNSVVSSVGYTPAKTQSVTNSVDRYDDGSYQATLQDLRTLGGSSGGTAAITPRADSSQGTIRTAAQPTGVRAGINWNTLVKVGPNFIKSTGPNEKTYFITGNIWSVQTVLGSRITLFEADPLAQQPPATQALPGFQDPSFNCHSFSFGAKDVVCPDGQTRSFQIFLDADAKAILRDAYTRKTVDEAFDPATNRPFILVFYDKDGNIIHSAVNFDGQAFVRHNNILGNGLSGQTVVSSKNGDQAFRPTTTVSQLLATYPNTNIKIYVANP